MGACPKTKNSGGHTDGVRNYHIGLMTVKDGHDEIKGETKSGKTPKKTLPKNQLLPHQGLRTTSPKIPL